MLDLKNKKLIVTGGAGFLGKSVVEKLLKRNVKEENLFIPRSKDYDLRKIEDIKRMFNDFPTDIIIHLAAKVGGIGYNMEKPGELFYDNIIMGVQLMEEARLRNIEKFVGIGTVCAYPKFTPVPFKEEDLWAGYPEETNAPYGLAKKMLLVQSQAYRKQYGFKSIFLLPTNFYGPEDNFDSKSSHVIPALIKKCVENKEKIIVWGNGLASREFLYVEDAAEGICLATERYNKQEPVNLGTGKDIKIKDLVTIITEETGFNGKVIWDITKPDGQPRRCLDVSKAKEEFAFEAKMDFREGIRRTIDWYLKHKNGF